MKLSVIIPTHNRASILQKCLERLAAQQVGDFEVIVVSDGSTDNTEEVVKSFCHSERPPKIPSVAEGRGGVEESADSLIIREDGDTQKHIGPSTSFSLRSKSARDDRKGWSRLKFIQQPASHQGVARNRGVKEASGDIILFIGDDIFAQPDFLKHHLDRHLEHPEENVVVVGLTAWDPELEINDYMRFLDVSGWQFGYPFIRPGLIGHHQPFKFFHTSNLSIKKSFFEKEPFNEEFRTYGWEDMEVGYRLWKNHDMKIYYEPKAFAYHHHLIPESELPQKMRKIGKSAVHFQKLHPEIWALPRGFKKWIIKMATNPVTLPLGRLLGKNFYFKLRSWREFWRGVREVDIGN